MELSLWISGKRNAVVAGSRNWLVDFYSPGPPPIVVEFLNKRNKFYEKIVKLLDLQKTKDARAIMVATRASIDQDCINLAMNFGIYLVLNGEEHSLKIALSGGDLVEVNNSTRTILLKMRNRNLAKECRNEILDLLSRECLTYKEIAARLNLRFGEKTVYAQLRSLRSKGNVVTLCRREDGTAIFGLPAVTYPVRDDLSRPSRALYIKNLILGLLKKRDKPITYLEIMSLLGLQRNIVTSALRDLRRRGLVSKTQDGWTLAR
ncbi:MAG: hypothetical protein ACP5KV_00850 [Candidatus Methanomethylicaceae archaeon]